MGLVELIMAKNYEVKCKCGLKDIVEAGLQDALKRCPDCKDLPIQRVKLAAEAAAPWAKK
jgi:hypothetical protein